jgi:TPR repeat protein
MLARLVCLAYFIVLALSAVPARADMAGARDALARGDASTAFHEYEKLAQFGNATAQVNAGTMLLAGQGVAPDRVSGAAWLIVAKENTQQPKSTPEIEATLSALSAEQMSAARALADRRAHEIATVLPKPRAPLPNTATDHNLNLPRRWDPFNKTVERQLLRAPVVLGWVVMRVIVDADGAPVDAWVPEVVPGVDLARAALAGVRTMSFGPAAVGGQHVASSFMFTSSRLRNDIQGYDRALQVYFDKSRHSAEAGNLADRYALARTSIWFPQLSPATVDLDKAHVWMRELANDPNQALAMYVLPDTTTKAAGSAVDMPFEEQEQWRLRSAQAGFAPAQLDMALMCWGERASDSMERARHWLESASAAGFPPASRYLAALLLSPKYRDTDGPHALALIDALLQNEQYADDPDTWQLVADAYAVQGNFQQAIAHQSHAIALLPKRSPRAPRFAAHLASFQNNAVIDDELLTIPAAAAYH